MSEDNLVSIYKAANPQQAAILKMLLEDEGVRARVTNSALEVGAGELPVGWSTAPQVLVAAKDAEYARALALDWDQRLADASKEVGELAEQMLAEPTQIWNNQSCPICNEPRHAICPTCHTAGADFEPAEFMQADGSGGVFSDTQQVDPAIADSAKESADEIDPKEFRLMCSVCDQSFRPQFVRHCSKCGNDFGDGIELAADEVAAGLNGRAMFVLVLMVVGAVAGAIYFFTIAG